MNSQWIPVTRGEMNDNPSEPFGYLNESFKQYTALAKHIRNSLELLRFHRKQQELLGIPRHSWESLGIAGIASLSWLPSKASQPPVKLSSQHAW